MRELVCVWLLLIGNVAFAQLGSQSGEINFAPVNETPLSITYHFAEAPDLTNATPESITEITESITALQNVTGEENIIHIVEVEGDPAPIAKGISDRFRIIRHIIPIKLYQDIRTVLKESWVKPNKVDWVMGSVFAAYGGSMSTYACMSYHMSAAATVLIPVTAMSLSMINTLANQTVNKIVSRGLKKPNSTVQKLWNRITSSGRAAPWDFAQAMTANFVAVAMGYGNTYSQLFTEKFLGITASGLFAAQKNELMGTENESFATGNRGYLNRAYVMLTSLVLIPLRAYEQIGKLPAITHIGSFTLHFPFHYQLRASVLGAIAFHTLLSIPNKFAKNKVLGILEKITGFIDPKGTLERSQTLVSSNFCDSALGGVAGETVTDIIKTVDDSG